ncbi:hypothetical protein KKA33_01030 [Patescibacteria group bacterium]|nr:hypothetical protein [Patescibacteria group bacterium]
MKNCKNCNTGFQITDEDRRLLKMFDAPDPNLCFPCRLQRRMAFYNRRRLYKRKCDLTGKPIISIFSPDKPFKAYETRNWYSDKWDPMEYGRDFDFSKPFFEQFHGLLLDVPQNALAVLGDNVNSDYTNDNYKLKNCYLVFDGEQAENAYYGETFVGLKDCIDFLFLYQSELCYECAVCDNCYNLNYSRFCKNCSDSWFLRDCIGCKNCFGCANLHQKEYHLFNEPKTKKEYEKFLTEFQSGHYGIIEEMKKKVEAFYITQPVKATRGVQNIKAIGDNLNNCKNACYCFDCNDLQDCRYCTDCLLGGKDCMDIHVWGDGMERCYNSCVIGVGSINVHMSCYVALGANDIYYSYWCTRNCKDCFGCIGLTHKQYCILNKQYSKEAYKELSEKIIEHMKSTGEWGEFFPAEISPFGYNETLAQNYFPLKKEEVLKKGWQWCDFEPEIKAEKTIPADRLPDDIKDVPDDILNWAIVCEESKKPFKIILQELKFYREHNLPLPRRHPDQRHIDLLKLKQPFRLWNRKCGKCGADIQTAYSPDRPEKVYCESCYLKTVY